MKITKYEHACITIEQDDQMVIIDPGNFTTSLEIPENVVAIVVTHEHPDHFDPDMLAAIYNKNPKSILVSIASIVEKMPDHLSRIIATGDTITIGAFTLSFFGGRHAQIHSSIPIIDNVGVLVNDSVYYPGDSFTIPNRPVTLLALPMSGPWLKLSDAIDCLVAIKPTKVFPTHDIHNSVAGKELTSRIVGSFAKNVESEFVPLEPSQSIEVS